MSILKSIFEKIFNRANADTPTSAQTQPAPSADPRTTVSPATNTSTQSTSQISETDVEQVLNDLAKKSGQPLNWRTSIVDLLKLLGLDSSLQSRKELAQELNYSGDTNDSASMNIWLHKQVMNKLAENGGKVPAELKD